MRMRDLFEMTQQEMEQEIQDEITLASGEVDPKFRSLNVRVAAQNALIKYRGNVRMGTAIADAIAQQGFNMGSEPATAQQQPKQPAQAPHPKQQAPSTPKQKTTKKRSATKKMTNPFKPTAPKVPSSVKGVTDFVKGQFNKGANIAKKIK